MIRAIKFLAAFIQTFLVALEERGPSSSSTASIKVSAYSYFNFEFKKYIIFRMIINIITYSQLKSSWNFGNHVLLQVPLFDLLRAPISIVNVVYETVNNLGDSITVSKKLFIGTQLVDWNISELWNVLNNPRMRAQESNSFFLK